MNKRKIIIVNIQLFLLSGCGIGGFWMNGNPYVKNHIPSLLDRWDSPDKTVEEKRQQWVACGGRANGYYWVDPTGLTDDEYKATSRKKSEQLQICMLSMGYYYRGLCDNEVVRTLPACLKRSASGG